MNEQDRDNAIKDANKLIKTSEDRITKLEKKISKINTKREALNYAKYKYHPEANKVSNMSSSKFVKGAGLNLALSVFSGVGSYKDSRREGKSVASAGAKAVGEFALAETFGLPYMAYSLVKEVPKGAVKGANAVFTEARKMNSASQFSIFGDAEFNDTQQLATMRQSGMELAKMSQYRLEQTLMGNEAKYLHR